MEKVQLAQIETQISVDGCSQSDRVGLLISGGIDSAILAALLIRRSIKNKDKSSFFPFVIKKSDQSFCRVPSILKFLKDHFKVQIAQIQYVGDATLHHSLINKSAIKEIFEKKLCDHLYLGLTKNPPVQLPGLAPDRPSAINHAKIHAPFLGINKAQVLMIAKELSLLPLLSLTHTCTEEPQIPCLKCWQCSEKLWAFSIFNNQR